MDSRRFEEMGQGWADTAHATELQPVFCSVVRIGRFGPGPVLPTGYFCPDIVVETPALFVALVVFCSVGRIGTSPPDRPIRTTLQKQGTTEGHTECK